MIEAWYERDRRSRVSSVALLLGLCLGAFACAPRPQVVVTPCALLRGRAVGEPFEPIEPLLQARCCPTGQVLLYATDDAGHPVSNLDWVAMSPSFSQTLASESIAPGIYLIRNVPSVDVTVQDVTVQVGYCWPDRNDQGRFPVHVTKGHITPVLVVVQKTEAGAVVKGQRLR
jgi:hypothetical protein